MKLAKGICCAIIAACLFSAVFVALMFEADTIELHNAIRLLVIFTLVALAAFGAYWAISYEERIREDWQELLKKPNNDRHR